jgi:hypothetical protein
MRFRLPPSRALLAAISLAAPLSTPALAGPLDPRLIPADAIWAAHLDMDAAATSPVCTFMRTSMPPELRAALDDFTARFGLDPFTDIHGITVFGRDHVQRSGAAIVITSTATDQLPERLAAAKLPGFTATASPTITRMSWTDNGKSWHAAILRPTSDTRALIFTGSEADLDSAIPLVEPSRAAEATLALTDRRPREGSFFFAAVRDIAGVSDESPRAQVLKAATSLSIDVGESRATSDVTLFAHVRMDAASPKDATNIRDMVQGMMAVAKLGFRARPDLASEIDSLMASAKLSTTESAFNFDAEHPAKEVIRVMDLLSKDPPATPNEPTAKPK